MKKNIGELFNEVVNDAKYKEDRIVHPSDMRINEIDGKMQVGGSIQFHMNDWAMAQFATKLGIPSRYYRMIPPELQAENANHFLRQLDYRENKWMLRTKVSGDGSGLIRGVLSEKYSPFDNHEIMEIMNELMMKMNHDYEVQMWHHDDGSMHLRVTLDSFTTSVGKTLDGRDDIHKVGFHLSNSEVGKSMIRIQPLVYRQVCTNGLMMWAKDGEGFEQRHMGLRHNEIYNRVAESLVHSVRAGHEMIDSLIKAKEIKVENPFEMIDKLAKDKKYTQKFTDQVKNEFKSEPANNMFYIAQAFTAAGRSLHADDRIEIEKDAAKFLLKATA